MAVYSCLDLICVVIFHIQIVGAYDCSPWDSPSCGVNNTCPPNVPFLKINGSNKECLSTCGPGEVLRDTICIDVEKCERAVVDDGHCLERCPEGHVFFPRSLSEFFSFPETDSYQSISEDESRKTGWISYHTVAIFKHTKGEEHRIRCQKWTSCVFAISIIFGIGCFMAMLVYTYLHPRPFCIEKVSQLVSRWKQRQKLQRERDHHTAVGDDDESLLNENIGVQNMDDEVLIV